ncbi:hypothetical protein RUND412_010612 [Rhizina undulata]
MKLQPVISLLSPLTLVVARAAHYEGIDFGGKVGKGEGGISEELFAEFEELAKVVDIAYCVGSLNTGVEKPFKCLSFCRHFPSFELVQTWNTGLTLSDSCGYIALSHPPAPKRIILAFRGTYSIVNAVADLTFTKQEYIPYPEAGHSPDPAKEKCDGCGVHVGFLQSWTQTQKIIGNVVQELVERWGEEGYQLTLVGHSLGGAVAALAGLEFVGRGWRPVVTTFGEPKKFTPTTYRRLTHVNDPVPLLPFTKWGYSQHAGEHYIPKPDLPFSKEDVRLCEGDEDPTCAAGGGLNAGQLFWAHRDYFHRLGLCVPEDSLLRKIGVLEEGGVAMEEVKGGLGAGELR